MSREKTNREYLILQIVRSEGFLLLGSSFFLAMLSVFSLEIRFLLSKAVHEIFLYTDPGTQYTARAINDKNKEIRRVYAFGKLYCHYYTLQWGWRGL